MSESVRPSNRDNTDDAMDMELKAREQSILSKFMKAKKRMDRGGYDAAYMHNFLQKDK